MNGIGPDLLHSYSGNPNMDPPGDWSDTLGYGFLLAVVIVPPIAALVGAAWLLRRLLRA